MRIRKSNYNLNKRSRKLKDGEKRSLINKRTSTQKITYAGQSEIDASINFILKSMLTHLENLQNKKHKAFRYYGFVEGTPRYTRGNDFKGRHMTSSRFIN